MEIVPSQRGLNVTLVKTRDSSQSDSARTVHIGELHIGVFASFFFFFSFNVFFFLF